MTAETVRVHAVVGLGSNVGDRNAHLRYAVDALGAMSSGVRVSSLYETDPVGAVSQAPFLNAIVVFETSLPPLDLLRELHRIEGDRGRVREVPGGPRTLDLDLLFYGDRIIRELDLTVPHPRWKERRFVCVPLAQVLPDLIDPESGMSAAEWCRTTAETVAGVVPVEGEGWAS